MSPVIIAGFTDDEVALIAAESPEITQRRESLETMKSELEDGRDKLRQIMVPNLVSG